MAEFINPLADIGDKVQKLTMEIGMKAMQNPDEVGAAAVPYLRTVGPPVFSYFWAHGAPRIERKRRAIRSTSRSSPPHASTSRACCRDGIDDPRGAFELMEVDESLF